MEDMLTVKIRRDTGKKLYALKEAGQTYDDVINRLLKLYNEVNNNEKNNTDNGSNAPIIR